MVGPPNLLMMCVAMFINANCTQKTTSRNKNYYWDIKIGKLWCCMATKNKTPSPSQAAKLLKTLRLKARLSLHEMARLLGMERASSYQHYETRYKRQYLPVDFAQNVSSIFRSRGLTSEEVAPLLPIKTQNGAVNIFRVPLISWVEAGQMTDTIDPYPVGAAADYIYVDNPSATLIGLRVSGSSMDRIAPEGSVIIVDYADKTLVDGKFFVIRRGGDMATFKRYRANPSRFEPFSTGDHATIFPEKDVEIVGRVIKVIHDL